MVSAACAWERGNDVYAPVYLNFSLDELAGAESGWGRRCFRVNYSGLRNAWTFVRRVMSRSECLLDGCASIDPVPIRFSTDVQEDRRLGYSAIRVPCFPVIPGCVAMAFAVSCTCTFRICQSAVFIVLPIRNRNLSGRLYGPSCQYKLVRLSNHVGGKDGSSRRPLHFLFLAFYQEVYTRAVG